MKFQDCFMLRQNLAHLPIAEFDGSKYVGRMAIYVPRDDNHGTIRIGGNYAQYGDMMLIRSWEPAYQREHKGSFRVGPIGAVDPKDFRDNVRVDYVFVLPVETEEMVKEYNKLVEACEMLDSLIAWMETLDKKEFSESEFRLDEVMSEINVDLTDDRSTKVRELLKKNIKI